MINSYDYLYLMTQSVHNFHIVLTDKVENSFIQNYENKPLAVVGLDSVVVINSPNGILVARKDLGQNIGEVSKRITGKGI